MKKELKSLAKVVEVLDRHDIKFWMYGATLPSYIKDKDLYPWHTDIDLIVWREDFDKLVKIRKAFGLKYTFKEYTLTILKNEEENIFAVDISSFMKQNDKAVWERMEPKSRFGKILYFGLLSKTLNLGMLRTAKIVRWLLTKVNGIMIVRHTVPIHFFTELKEWDFFGLKIKVPKDTEDFLDYHYGKYWRIPTKEQSKHFRRQDGCHPDYYQVIKC